MTEIPPELVGTDEDEAVAIIAAYLQLEPDRVPRKGVAFDLVLAGIRRGKELAPVNLGGGGI